MTSQEYNPILGIVTRLEAGVLYKAVKQNKVIALPETTKELYYLVDNRPLNFTNSYNNDSMFYDCIYSWTEALMDEDYEKAQSEITRWEQEQIKYSGSKSPFHKYYQEEE